MKKSWYLVALILASCICARADYLLVGTTGRSTAEVSVASFQFLAQGFSLNHSSRVSEIDFFMSGYGIDGFTVQLTNAIGPAATASNVLFQAADIFPNTGGGINGAWVTNTTSLSLGAGNYYLVLSSGQNSIFQGWVAAGSLIPTSFGAVDLDYHSNTTFGPLNSAFPPASTWHASPVGFSMGFQVVGSVPEPSSLVMLCTGILGLGGLIPKVTAGTRN